MDIRQLEMFVAVAEKGGYLQAGNHLRISHSAIHRQMRILEQELGQLLFIRAGRTVRVSEAGTALLAGARRVTREISDLKGQIREMGMLGSGELSIGTETTTLTFFLPPVIRRFGARYPHVEIRLVTGTADQVIQELSDGKLDLGIVSEPLEGDPLEKHVRYERLFEEEFVVAVGKTHPLANRETIEWSELNGMSFILLTPRTRVRRMIDSCFRKAGVTPKTVMELENEDAIEKLVEVNLGAGFLSLRRARAEELPYLRISGECILRKVAAVVPASYVPNKTVEFLLACREQVVRTRKSHAHLQEPFDTKSAPGNR